VYFIYNIYFELAYLGRNPNLLNQVADIIDRIVRSSIQFMNIKGSRPVK